MQRRRPQLPRASLCVGPQAVCAVCWGEWQTGRVGSLQRPTSDLRSKASSHVSGAVTAFPSPVPHRLSRRGRNREWSQATAWASKDETHFLLATWLCVPLWTPCQFFPGVHFPGPCDPEQPHPALLLFLSPPLACPWKCWF